MRPAEGWAEAQRAFRAGYSAEPGSLARQPVGVRWWTNPALGGAGVLGLGGLLRRWWRGRGVSEGTYVALYAPAPAPEARPVVVFPVADGSIGEPSGSCEGVLVGELGLNGVCCLELGGGVVVWPTYNPVVPTGRRIVGGH
jgi:hypothetical protein